MIKIKLNSYFDLDSTISCGQIFRYTKDNDIYTIVLKDRVISVYKDNDYLIVDSNKYDNLEYVVKDYFDLNYDYDSIYNILNKDANFADIVEFNKGMKIINQDPFECLISYIISQNNRVASITNSLNLLARKYGERIIFNNKDYYLFPPINKLINLSKEEFKEYKVGFRDIYLCSTIKRINDNLCNLNEIENMSSDEAIKYLMLNKGIGLKVASCILLFSYHRFDVFPIDTWVLKYCKENFGLNNKNQISEYFNSKYKQYCGIAIQYIFNYNRNK